MSRSLKQTSHHLVLILLAVVSACVYIAIALLSRYFEFDSSTTERPIPLVLTLFGAAFVVYLLAIRVAARAKQNRRLLLVIFVGSVAFRLVMLPSVPIQEVDIYRYSWDGMATNQGVNPFRYSPEEVRMASPGQMLDEDLARLVRLRDRDPTAATILNRVHYGELPTVYPPVSQAVFAAATFTTPAGSTVWIRLLIMKAWFVGFDLATLFLVVKLLRIVGMPVGLCVIYGWCPLLMKEVANSGHLDAVAVFLTTLAVYLIARHLSEKARHTTSIAKPVLAAFVLGLAVGAKLYPVVLAPLMLMLVVRHTSWKVVSAFGLAFVAVTLLLIWPMLPTNESGEAATTQVDLSVDALPLPDSARPSSDPSRGIATFLRYWEMNDFIFLVTIENLKPTSELSSGTTAWFSMVPESFRTKLASGVSQTFGVNPSEVPFLVTRALTTSVFLIIATCLAWRTSRSSNADDWLRAAFLTLAWFWLLCPTQNPWYWIWALPLLAFSRNRAWLAVSGLVLLYYLRFWLTYHWADMSVLGTWYVGHVFFDFVVTWIEFAPWFVWLGVESLRVRPQGTDERQIGNEHSQSKHSSKKQTNLVRSV